MRRFSRLLVAFAFFLPWLATAGYALTPGEIAVLFGGRKPAFTENFLAEPFLGLPSANFTANFSVNRSSSYTGLVTGPDGLLTYPPNNRLLNTATLSTQSVTTTPNNYYLSFYGTGTVTLTGTSTAGPLVGSGVSTQVCLAFTPTAGSLTLTVSGTVTNAVLAAVTHETCGSGTPRGQDQQNTAGSAYGGPRFDTDPVTLLPKGLLVEAAGTNLNQYSNLFSSWSQFAMPAPTAAAGTGPDGLNSLWTLKTSAGTGTTPTLYLSGAPGTNTYTASVFAKAGTASWLGLDLGGAGAGAANGGAFFNLSTGAVGTVKAGVTATITPFGNGIYRCTVSKSLTSPAYVGLLEPHTADNQAGWNPAGTETILIYGYQWEPGSNATSYIPTAASSVTRPADVVTGVPGSAFVNAYKAASMSAVVEFDYGALSSSFPYVIDTGGYRLLYVSTSARAGIYDGGNAIVSSGGGTAPGSVARFGDTYSAAGRAVAFNGGYLVSDSYTHAAGVTIYLGASAGTGNFIDGHLRSIGIYTPALPGPKFQSETAVGARY